MNMYPEHITVEDTYNIYGEYSGKWSTCNVCGRQDKGWKHICPNVFVTREWDGSEEYAHIEVDHDNDSVTVAYLDGMTHAVSKEYARKLLFRRVG